VHLVEVVFVSCMRPRDAIRGWSTSICTTFDPGSLTSEAERSPDNASVTF